MSNLPRWLGRVRTWLVPTNVLLVAFAIVLFLALFMTDFRIARSPIHRPPPPGPAVEPPKLGMVEIVEPLKGPWVGNINWGKLFESPPGIAGLGQLSTTPVAVMQTDVLPGPPKVWTISLSKQRLETIGIFYGQLYARIICGIGGATQTVDLDWSEGSTVNVVANSISVQAYQLGQLAYRVRIGAAVGMYPSGKVRAPTFTYGERTLPAGLPGVLLNVPSHAKRLFVATRVWPTDLQVIPTQVNAFPTGPLYDIATVPTLISTGIPIGGQYDQVLLMSAAGGVVVTAQFELDL